MEEIIKILEQVKPGVDYKTEKSLIDNEILDSLDIVTIVASINRELDVEIPVSEIIPENFNSAEALYETVKRLEDE